MKISFILLVFFTSTIFASASEVIILFGKPASGKGWTANKIKENYKIISISSGDVIRKQVANNPEYQKIMNEGKLLNDQDVFKLMIKEIELNIKQNEDIILDGFPRTKEQAIELNKFLKSNKINYKTFEIQCSNEIVKNRMLERQKKEKRQDDNMDTFEKRLQTYNKITSEAVEIYKEEKRINFIDCSTTNLSTALFPHLKNLKKK